MDHRENARSMPPVLLNRTSYVPKYQQIVDQVSNYINSGRVSPGQLFWSEGEVASSLGVSKMTVRQAYRELRREGLLIIEKGRRPVIGHGRVGKDFQELRGFTEEMARRGMKASSKILEAGPVEPNAEIAKALELADGDKVCRIRRLRYADNDLVGLETTHFPSRKFPGLDRQNLETRSIYEVLESLYGVSIDWSHEEIEAIPASREEAKLLHVPPKSPLFSMRRTVYDGEGVPVEFGISHFRGDWYRATVISRRRK